MEPTDTVGAMRRTALLTMLLGLVLPAAAWAVRTTPGDGTLSVRNGDGQVRLVLERGVAIGRIASGSLTIVDPKNADCTAPLVWDDDGTRAEPTEKVVLLAASPEVELRCIFKGSNMRFRLAGPDSGAIRIAGTNIGLSVVGRGSGRIKGSPFALADGAYSVNGEEYASLPDDWKGFQLVAPNSAG
jgi:hypothetical protein